MDWFQNKTTQIITLVSIIGTLVGFGVTGGSYINRLENLEVKIGGLGEAEDNVQVIEERFAGIETSVPTASITAFITAGGAAIAPASPQPFDPNGLDVAGVVV